MDNYQLGHEAMVGMDYPIFQLYTNICNIGIPVQLLICSTPHVTCFCLVDEIVFFMSAVLKRRNKVGEH